MDDYRVVVSKNEADQTITIRKLSAEELLELEQIDFLNMLEEMENK
ncbi:MAG: hypothetical protein J6Z43_06450 [Clostridiales bacterium]|nr:hypothetical protein [Clostridiales bacterium]